MLIPPTHLHLLIHANSPLAGVRLGLGWIRVGIGSPLAGIRRVLLPALAALATDPVDEVSTVRRGIAQLGAFRVRVRVRVGAMG